MKNLYLSLIAIFVSSIYSVAQNSNLNSPATGISQTDNFTYNGYTVSHYGLGWYYDPSYGPPMSYFSAYGGFKFFMEGVPKGLWDYHGNLGIGTLEPAARLHVNSLGSSLNATQPFNGDMIIQGNPETRSTTTGASLEFVIPAQLNGSNPWGQARIMTVAQSNSDYDATGKMVLGTRRLFNDGSTPYWNYGDDFVIDGLGHIGIGILTPREALSVNGTIRSKEVKVETANWPDYVFKPTYQLPPLSEVKEYIDQNQHLPDMPSEAEVSKNGISLGEMNKLLVKKLEEVTLYLIEKDKCDQAKVSQLALQQKQINKLKQKLKVIQQKLKSN